MKYNDPDDPTLINPREYQDDIDANSNHADNITHENTDQPSDTLLVPNEALKEGLDAMAIDELTHSSEHPNKYEDHEDAREDIEDKDQGDLSNPDTSNANS